MPDGPQKILYFKLINLEQRILLFHGRPCHLVKAGLNITQHPQVERFVYNTAYFKDGFEAEFDTVIFCTGYIWHLPFMADDLRLKEQFFCVSKEFYKGTLWLNGGNRKVLYLGAPCIIYSFPFFEAQALWACKYIMEELDVPRMDEMVDDIEE